jgi:hypothetical protein
VAKRKTVIEMPTVTSLSKRMKEQFVFASETKTRFWLCHTTLSLFRLLLLFPFTHIMTRFRAFFFAPVMCLALLAQGGLVRKREQESEGVQARRDIRGMTSQASSRDRAKLKREHGRNVSLLLVLKRS